MQIGCCWFDMHLKTLSNQLNDTSWKMSIDEFSVLECLVNRRGQVLSMQDLQSAMPVEHRDIAYLSDAIERIRFYLGTDYAALVEMVDKQGYMLHNAPIIKSGNITAAPFGSISTKHYIIFIALLLGLLAIIYSLFDPVVKLKRINQQVLTTPTAQVYFYPVFISIEQQAQYRRQTQHLTRAIELCPQVPWQKIFLSVSTDKDHLISIVLKTESEGKVKIKNIKQVPVDPNWNFINQAWLKKVGVCG